MAKAVEEKKSAPDIYTQYLNYFCDILEVVEKFAIERCALSAKQTEVLKSVVDSTFLSLYKQTLIMKAEAKVGEKN